jgi:hypothetical protein
MILGRFAFALLLTTSLPFVASAQQAGRLDAEQIGRASGSKPTASPDGVVRIAWARSDVPVKVDRMP